MTVPGWISFQKGRESSLLAGPACGVALANETEKAGLQRVWLGVKGRHPLRIGGRVQDDLPPTRILCLCWDLKALRAESTRLCSVNTRSACQALDPGPRTRVRAGSRGLAKTPGRELSPQGTLLPLLCLNCNPGWWERAREARGLGTCSGCASVSRIQFPAPSHSLVPLKTSRAHES